MIRWIKNKLKKGDQVALRIKLKDLEKASEKKKELPNIQDVITEIMNARNLNNNDAMRLGRIGNLISAYKLSMTAALYSGTNLTHNNENNIFCHSKTGKVFTISEIRNFDVSKIPNLPNNYSPFIDMGHCCSQDNLFCRHSFDYISSELAQRWRPDLSDEELYNPENRIKHYELKECLKTIQQIIEKYELDVELLKKKDNN